MVRTITVESTITRSRLKSFTSWREKSSVLTELRPKESAPCGTSEPGLRPRRFSPQHPGHADCGCSFRFSSVRSRLSTEARDELSGPALHNHVTLAVVLGASVHPRRGVPRIRHVRPKHRLSDCSPKRRTQRIYHLSFLNGHLSSVRYEPLACAVLLEAPSIRARSRFSWPKRLCRSGVNAAAA